MFVFCLLLVLLNSFFILFFLNFIMCCFDCNWGGGIYRGIFLIIDLVSCSWFIDVEILLWLVWVWFEFGFIDFIFCLGLGRFLVLIGLEFVCEIFIGGGIFGILILSFFGFGVCSWYFVLVIFWIGVFSGEDWVVEIEYWL